MKFILLNTIEVVATVSRRPDFFLYLPSQSFLPRRCRSSLMSFRCCLRMLMSCGVMSCRPSLPLVFRLVVPPQTDPPCTTRCSPHLEGPAPGSAPPAGSLQWFEECRRANIVLGWLCRFVGFCVSSEHVREGA